MRAWRLQLLQYLFHCPHPFTTIVRLLACSMPSRLLRRPSTASGGRFHHRPCASHANLILES